MAAGQQTANIPEMIQLTVFAGMDSTTTHFRDVKIDPWPYMNHHSWIIIQLLIITNHLWTRQTANSSSLTITQASLPCVVIYDQQYPAITPFASPWPWNASPGHELSPTQLAQPGIKIWWSEGKPCCVSEAQVLTDGPAELRVAEVENCWEVGEWWLVMVNKNGESWLSMVRPGY